jgi:leader peptidase (prepilin peptidase) / N-methyltransferase
VVFENLASLFSALGLGYLALTAWPLAKTDIQQRRLPNRYVLPAFPITWLGQLGAGIATGLWWNMLWAALAMLITFAVTLGVNRLGLLGMGDVKLMSAMALALGWYSLILPVIALLISFLIAGLVAAMLLILGKIKLGGSMPLGPYLLVGFFGAITVGAWS